MNESFEDCATRETFEETGLAICTPTFAYATNCVAAHAHYVTIFMQTVLGPDDQVHA